MDTSTLTKISLVASVLSTPVLAYHGYRRTGTVGNALLWGILGAIVWPITVPVALAQGYGKQVSKTVPVAGLGCGCSRGKRR